MGSCSAYKPEPMVSTVANRPPEGERKVDALRPRVAIICCSGTIDRLYPAAVLAAEAVDRGLAVSVLLTFWAVMAVRRTPGPFAQLVSRDCGVQGSALAELIRQSPGTSWIALLGAAKQRGDLHVSACAFTLNLFDITAEELDPVVESVVGMGSFLADADGSVLVF